jgi:SHS2 domain-containing protein
MYKFLEDIAIADIAFQIEAPELPQLFREAVDAFLEVQITNPQNLKKTEVVELNLEDTSLDLLLYRFLQELVYYKDVKQWLLKVHTITVEKSPKGHRLQVQLKGEKLDPARHDQRADVKAVTLHQLQVKKGPGEWGAKVVLDV